MGPAMAAPGRHGGEDHIAGSPLDIALCLAEPHKRRLLRAVGRWGVSFQTWGMFSVTDHLGQRAFVADVVLYDRLVIPVPDAEERKRWTDLGRRPDVLERKLDILEELADRPEDSVVERRDWTPGFRDFLDLAYPYERKEARDTTNPAWGNALDRVVLARAMRSGRLGEVSTPEIVPAYTSYSALDSDFKLGTVPAERVARPDDRLVGVIGWEFFVPEDSALDDDSLLKQTVRLVQDERFRAARAAFHEFRRDATRLDASPKQFLRELESKLVEYQKATARAGRARVRTTTLRAFALVGASVGLAAAISGMAPVEISGAALGVAGVGVDIGWRSPSPGEPPQAVAMFHDARKHFGWHD
jgi:hypothetical protein